jgi:hypothetical protein
LTGRFESKILQDFHELAESGLRAGQRTWYCHSDSPVSPYHHEDVDDEIARWIAGLAGK